MSIRLIFLRAISLLLTQACTSLKQNQQDSLHLYQSLSQDWFENGTATWTQQNQILSGKSGLGYAVTKKSYSDFILEAEFIPDATMNSGIFIRCPEVEFTATGCYEINIADNHANQDFRTGSIVTHGKPSQHVNSVNKWNSYRISAIGNHIEVWLNGIKTADLIDDKSQSGYIGLQVNGEGIIHFRNVRLWEK